MNLLEAASELLPPGVHLERRGCLGRCGSGPNVCLMPSGLLVSYCATPAQLAHLIELQCVGGGGTRKMLHALEVRVLSAAAWRVCCCCVCVARVLTRAHLLLPAAHV
jgi:hypothetical protein